MFRGSFDEFFLWKYQSSVLHQWDPKICLVIKVERQSLIDSSHFLSASSLFLVVFFVNRTLLSRFNPDKKLLYSKRTHQNPSVLITMWLWSLGHHPPGHRREDPHALSDVRYSSWVQKLLVMWSNTEASSTFWSVTAQHELVQVVWGEKGHAQRGHWLKPLSHRDREVLAASEFGNFVGRGETHTGD